MYWRCRNGWTKRVTGLKLGGSGSVSMATCMIGSQQGGRKAGEKKKERDGEKEK